MLDSIFAEISKAGGYGLRVGGCVRDKYLGIDSKDIDIEVYELSYDELVAVLSKFGQPKTVGRFSVVKLTVDGLEYDFCLPRRDSKVAAGHKGFIISTFKSLSPQEAALRRDFTINSISEDANGVLIDPYNGIDDLNNRVLRATSGHFVDDPLRVLRGFQFAARFGMVAESRTVEMCKQLRHEFHALSIGRIWYEFEKFAMKATKPSLGIQFLVDVGWLECFPDLFAMLGSPQDPIWHPEGCVLTHTAHCLDAAVEIADREGVHGEDRVVLMMAVLCHDIGKPATLSKNDFGRYINHGHAEAGVPIAERFLKSIGAFPRIIERVLPLVRFHMVHTSLNEESITHQFVRRLSRNLGNVSIAELAMVMEADHSGRPPLPKGLNPLTQVILDRAVEVAVHDAMPKPILLGRHLINEFGLQPGVEFGVILKDAFEAQLRGDFNDLSGGLDYVKMMHKV